MILIEPQKVKRNFNEEERIKGVDSVVNLIVQKIDNQLFISISNTGKVIDEEILPNIFDRYFRTLSMEGSTGLGLAIVKKIIELHQTDITVKSENNLTTFTFLRNKDKINLANMSNAFINTLYL